MEFPTEGIGVLNDAFQHCEDTIAMAEQANTWNQGKVGNRVDEKARITDVHFIDQQHPLHAELVNAFVNALNLYQARYDMLDVNGGEPLRLARYPVGGHYVFHSDARKSERVMSGVLYLNDQYEGGELVFKYQELTIRPTAGQLVLFPSTFLFVHRSNPIRTGKKYAVLGWFN